LTNILPPPPVREPISTNNGLISSIWVKWFFNFFVALGEQNGDVIGPDASLIGEVALFSDSSGKRITGGGTLGTLAYLNDADFARVSDLATVAFTGDYNDLINPPNIITWNEVTASQTMFVNNGYVANNSSQVVLALPPFSNFGEKIRVVGKGAGGWKITQNAGQTIHFGSQNTTTGVTGYLESQSTFDAIELLCTTANTNWTELSAQGNIIVI
jgi:hypothetical protein